MKKTRSNFEKEIALKYYVNEKGFLGGKIREKPEDFVVEEVSDFKYEAYSKEKENQYKYLVLEVKAKNWDNNNLIKHLSNKLGISRNRIKFAGTKDKKAITKQLITIYDIKKSEIKNLEINNVEITDFGLSNKEINIGDLLGNNFKIKIRSIKNTEKIDSIISLIQKEGIINYFGPQRFGETRPISHLVGKEIVKENYEKAVKTYLTKSFVREHQEIRELREELKRRWGEKEAIKKALKVFPNYLSYERTLLDQLYKNKLNYVEALKKFPHNLLTLFVHAYQSYLFNKSINKRIEKNLPINDVSIGEIVCYDDYEKNIPNRKATERVTERNKEKIKKMVKKEKAYPTAPLFGTKTKISLGKMGEIEEEILVEENLELSDFEIKKIPEISSTGLRREIVIYPKIQEAKRQSNYLQIEFFMPKGTYATSVTREFRGEVNGR